MSDEDRCCPQVMQSCWTHNEYNSAWFFQDTLVKYLMSNDMQCCIRHIGDGIFEVTLYTAKGSSVQASDIRVVDAFFKCLDELNTIS